MLGMGYDARNVSHNPKHTHNLGERNTQTEEITRREGRGVAELSADAVIDRMREVLGVKTDLALGRYFELGTSAVSNWRQRGRVPFEECVILSDRKGVSLDWLLRGVGRPTLMVREDTATYLASEAERDPRLQRLAGFIAHWNATRSEDDKVWLEMQLARAVPEYAEWVATRKH